MTLFFQTSIIELEELARGQELSYENYVIPRRRSHKISYKDNHGIHG